MTAGYHNYWAGKQIDNGKTAVFVWSGYSWHEIVNGVTIKTDFKEVINNAHTVVIDQGAGPLFLTEDGAYWDGKRYAIGTFNVRKHQEWIGKRPSGDVVAFKWNESIQFWEQIDNGFVTKNDFAEVENNAATVTINQGAGPIYLTNDGAYYGGERWAVGGFAVPS